jgi:gliding motility-associated-like protein
MPRVNTLTYSVTTPDPTSTAQCTTSTTVPFTVVPDPGVSVTPIGPLCVSSLVRQTLAGTPAGGVWSGPGVSLSGQTYSFLPTGGAATYQLRYTITDGPCAYSANLSVVVSNTATATAPADTVLCPGTTQAFRLRGAPAGGTWTGPGVTGNATTGYQFAPAGLTGSASLTYSVVNGGCSATATRRVSIAPVPDGVPAWTPVACPEIRLVPLAVRFQVPLNSAAPYTSLEWDFGDGTTSTETSPLHTYATVGTFQPRLRQRYSQGRCEVLTALPPVVTKERKVPNIITPNGDGQNETFQLGPDCVPRFQVFSRWGQQVFESAAYHDEWSAAGLPDGVYYYLLTYADGHRVKGWVEVVR